MSPEPFAKHFKLWCRTVAAFLALTALGAYCVACVAVEQGNSVGEPKQVTTSASEAAPKAESETVGKSDTANVREDNFPLPIWRNRTFDCVHDLAGALLHTTDGAVQIAELTWGADQEGKIYGCFLSAFTREGERVEFGSSEACTARIVKEHFLGSAMTGSDNTLIESFDFATDHEGYLFVADITYKQGAAARLERDACSMETVQTCASEGCSGTCGVPLIEIELAPIGGARFHLAFNSPVLKEPLECKCSGESGKCVVEWRSRCAGSCAEGRVCTSFDNFSCECR